MDIFLAFAGLALLAIGIGIMFNGFPSIVIHRGEKGCNGKSCKCKDKKGTK